MKRNISGRNEITDFEEVVRLDMEYIKQWNIGMDITGGDGIGFAEIIGNGKRR